MEERQGYDVLRIVVHSGRCYMSTDYVKGKPLILWLKYHSRIGKRELFGWIRELLEELGNFHQCRGNPSYQYVNPYSIIVGEDRKLFLLDLGSREQEELLHLMQRRYVRENFLSPDNQYYQKVAVQEDIYGFGKTVQYMLSVAEVDPPLGKLEEFKIKRMISRCVDRNSKRCYQEIQEISEHFPKNKKKNQEKIRPIRIILVCAAVITGAAVMSTQIMSGPVWDQEKKKGEDVSGDVSDAEDAESKALEDYREEFRQSKEQWELEKEAIETKANGRERELVYELALLYFIDLEEYQKSREVMESIAEPEAFAADFAKLCFFMEGRMAPAADRDIEQLLERLEGEVPDPEEERYAYCISKGYEKMNERVSEAEVKTGEVQEEIPQEDQQQEAQNGEEPEGY